MGSFPEPRFPCIEERARGGIIEFILNCYLENNLRQCQGKVPDIWEEATCSFPKVRRSWREDSRQFGEDINLLSRSLDAETESFITRTPAPEHGFLAIGLPREAMECHCEGLWQVVALLM